MRTSIDQQRHASGVESICRPIQVAPSGYWLYAAQQRNPELRCAPIQCAEVLSTEIERVWLAKLQVYEADKMWCQLRRVGTGVVRCTVGPLVRKVGLRGVTRARCVKATAPDAEAPGPLDRVNHQSRARRPNYLWISDFTHVSTWQRLVVCPLYQRRLRPTQRQLAGQQPDADRFRAQRAEIDAARASAGTEQAGPSYRPRSRISVDEVQRTLCRSGHRTVCGKQGQRR